MNTSTVFSWRQSFFRTRPLKFLAAGILLGIIDNLFFHFLGVEMTLNSYSANFAVGVFFSLSFGLFAWTIGVLLENRQDIIAYQKELRDKEALATIGRMTSGVAHEVRNPLTVIKSSALLLQVEATSPAIKKAAQFIVEESNRLNDFVSSLLDYSRPIQLQITSTPARSCLEDAWGITDHKDCEMMIEGQMQLDLAIDQQTFIPMLSSLFLNACQAMEGRGTIQITLDRVRGLNQIKIKDQGPGITDDFSENLFKPFHTNKPKGTGLGLAMAKKIVEYHKGEIYYQKTHSGSIFAIEIP